MRQFKTAALRAYFAFCNRAIAPVVGRRCPACGRRALLFKRGRLHAGLVADWQLSPKWVRRFNEREFTYCMQCRATVRDRVFAAEIVAWAHRASAAATSLAELAALEPFQKLRVAEINSIGRLHCWLAALPHLNYSEYGSTEPAVPDENLLALSYADASFDLVVTSETFEHTPDFPATQREVFRVLRPGGTHLFTIPVLWDRPTTLRRAAIVDGEVIHHAAPSYHGDYAEAREDFLVFYEFGRDVVELIKQAGFDVKVHEHHNNPSLAVFEAVRPL